MTSANLPLWCLRLLAASVTLALAMATLTGPEPADAAPAPPVTVAVWRTAEITLHSSRGYGDPFADAQVTAVFRGPAGAVIERPAFWDGGSTWRIRFAPTAVGDWTMSTVATDRRDTGLHGVRRTIRAVPYTGELDIYRHGFLTTSDDGHHLAHADGTPFLYLGDTHWILPHERFSTSNAPGVRSQFKYVVDKRVDQGFTVYQSEPIWQPHGASDQGAETHHGPDEEPVADVTDGMQAADLAGFGNLDRKFEYIADAGLVHANAMIAWVGQPKEFALTPEFMARMARYWVARYGSYPVIWTVGQELDKDFYGRYAGAAMAPWTAAIEELDRADDYGQPLMPHQENIGSTTSENSRFAGRPWHDGFASQWQSTDDWNLEVAENYWRTGKPTLAYETPYEDFWTDGRHALSAFYKSYLLGMRGYGYGVSGLWNDVYSVPGQPLDAGTEYELPARYQWWYTGANRPTADQLSLAMKFFRGLQWWKLTPRFDQPAWSDFAAGNNFVASDADKTYLALFADGTTRTGSLNGLDPRHYYTATWFDPRTGARTLIDDRVEAPAGSWRVPAKPSGDDWVLLVRRGNPLGATPSRPLIEPADAEYTRAQRVTIQSPTRNAVIHYTTDGATPTAASPVYRRPIRVSDPADVVVRAIAISRSGRAGSVASAVLRPALTKLVPAAVTASSTAPGHSPGQLTDRDRATLWRPAGGAESWIELAYPSDTVVDTVLLTGRGDVSYRIESTDGDTWRTVTAGQLSIGAAGNGSVVTFPQVRTGRLRMVFTAGSPEITELGTYDDPDLTTGATATASRSAGPGLGPDRAIDADPGTGWRGCDGDCWDGAWIEVDLGQPTTFDTVELQPSDGGSGRFAVEYERDGQWHTAAEGSAGTVSFGQQRSSRLRVRYTTGAGGPGLLELSVFDNPDLTVGGTFSASSRWDDNQSADNAFDGSLETNWQACDQCWAGEWLEVDFGQPTTFDNVTVSEYGNRTTGYRIEYWSEGRWQTAHTGTTGFGEKGETTTVSFGEVTGTKARIRYLSGTANAPIVYEFSIFRGTGPVDSRTTSSGVKAR